MSSIQTVALLGGLAVFNMVSCLPLLFFSSIKRLFKTLPAGNLSLNYILGMANFHEWTEEIGFTEERKKEEEEFFRNLFRKRQNLEAASRNEINF